MDCPNAQEAILESLVEALGPARVAELETHLAGCSLCRSFLERHSLLDLQLTAAISAPALDPAFRGSVMKKLRPDPLSVWPAFLPDLAHLLGCLCATVACIWLLPFTSGSVMLAGLAVTLVTYFAQSLLQGSLEAWEEDK